MGNLTQFCALQGGGRGHPKSFHGTHNGFKVAGNKPAGPKEPWLGFYKEDVECMYLYSRTRHVRAREGGVSLDGVTRIQDCSKIGCLSPKARTTPALHQNRNLEPPQQEGKVKSWGRVYISNELYLIQKKLSNLQWERLRFL